MKDKKPFFSIIIPTHNRPERLEACLASLNRLEYPKDRFEVIVVDDGSSVELNPIVHLFSNKLDLQLLRQENTGPAAARNLGVQQTKGEFLVFTDDDCQPGHRWLAVLAGLFEKKPDAMVGGEILNSLPENLFSSASQLLISYLYSYYNKNADNACFFTSNNIALSKRCFLAVGGFTNNWKIAAAEDRDFCDRWLRKGKEMIYAPEAVIYHAHKMSLTGFCKQHFNYGRGAYFFHQARNIRNQAPVRIEPLSFYLNLLSFPFLKFKKLKGAAISGLLVLAQIANALGFFYENFNRKSKNRLPRDIPASAEMKDIQKMRSTNSK